MRSALCAMRTRMDILNRLSPRRFREVDDLLAFISIYDDTQRTRAFRRLLRAQQKHIHGAVCVEGGCGLGVLSIEMAQLGARQVYAIEQNPLLAKLARERVAQLPKNLAQRIEVIETPLQNFRPPQMIDVLNSTYELHCDDPSHASMYPNSWSYSNIHYYAIVKPPTPDVVFDWKVWLVGFEYVNGQPYLFGAIHFVWEP